MRKQWKDLYNQIPANRRKKIEAKVRRDMVCFGSVERESQEFRVFLILCLIILAVAFFATPFINAYLGVPR